MKLIRFGKKGAEKPGVLVGNKRLDCSSWFKDWDRDFFENGGLKILKKRLKRKGAALPIVPKKVRWGSPIARPGMIICIGLNYSDKIGEKLDLSGSYFFNQSENTSEENLCLQGYNYSR